MGNILKSQKNIQTFLTGRDQNILPHIKNILFVVPLLLASFNYDMAFAVTYQIPVDVSFTFNSTATLSISGDLVIENLTPGNSSDSNIITISASSNNIVGYDIEATVGDSTNNYTDLRISSSDSTNVFTSLSSNVSALNSFSNDKWGYSYSTDNGTTWVSGNTGSTNTGYNGLPLYTGTGVKLADTSSAGSSTIKFKIGAKASDTRVSGDYTNVINFQMTSKILTTNYTLNYLPNDGNNGQDVSGMPNPATVSNTITQNTNYTLSNSTPTRSGYTFAGWCDGTVTSVNYSDSCTGTTYQPGDAYTIRNVGSNITILLYALWESNTRFISFGVCVFDYHNSYSLCDDPETYVAEEDMTWGEWIDSSYSDTAYQYDDNTPGTIGIGDYEYSSIVLYCYTYSGGVNGKECKLLYNPGGYYEHGTYVLPSDYIQPNAIYNLLYECLTGDHLITMGDGSLKRLDKIKCGDYVKSYDWSTNKLVPKKVIFSDADEEKIHIEYDEWTFDDGTIIKTVHRHEFYNVEAKRFKYMDEWKIGEHTYKEDGTRPALIAHETIKKTVRHYKITLEGGTNYFANGLLTGDRYNPKNIVL